VPAKQLKEFRNVAVEADRLRSAGKIVSASASFSGRLRVVPVGDLPAEFTFDSLADLKVEALPDASEMPVIPICELFQNLTASKGKRIAVRGESVGTMEGSWIVGRCQGSFFTNGYRWPVVLDYSIPAYYTSETAQVADAKWPSTPPKGEGLYKGKQNVVMTATYVGHLRMREEYTAVCRAGGDYMTNGFGHLNGAAAELIVEAVTDVEVAPRNGADDADDRAEPHCQPANTAELCSGAPTLVRAATLGCVDRVRELLSKIGIDSRDGSESASLSAAIRTGHEMVVKLLVEAGAPVNPVHPRLWAPLAEAAHRRNISIMKLLLKAGAAVDGLDNQGGTYLASYGFFDTRITRILLEAGANPNATDNHGQTALMHASGYGYEDAIKLLIEHRADVNLRDDRGRSALMHAAAGKYVDAIPILLKNGAGLYARDRDGKTALDIVRSAKNEVAIELLSEATKKGR
jgi:hypothetical protein